MPLVPSPLRHFALAPGWIVAFSRALLVATLSAQLMRTYPHPPTQAAGAVADRMKPQELANSCWAWATMRFFPGAAVLDGMLMHAGGWLRGEQVEVQCTRGIASCGSSI